MDERYGEPIAAMQDDDLIFAEHIQYAYHAVYNLFRKYTGREAVDDWLIANQALSSETDAKKREALFGDAIREAELDERKRGG